MPSPSTTRRALANLGSGARRFFELAATPLLPADYLDLINPMRAGADLRGRVVDVAHETPTSTSVTIRPGRGWRGHRPGQYTRIGVDVNGVRHWRAYSITSPTGDVITISARAIEGGVVSNHLLTGLQPGTMLMLDQATGDFTMSTPPPRSALFITGGSGITPVMGILRSHLHELRDVAVVHSAPDPEQMMFRSELQHLHRTGRIRLTTRFTRTEGILPLEGIGAVVPDWQERETWACGPTGLLDDAEAVWAAADIPHLLHTERFRPRVVATGEGGEVTFRGRGAAGAATATGAAGGAVRSAGSAGGRAQSATTTGATDAGLTVDAPAGIPLLDVGEAAGVLMPSGCRMGICFNCVLPLEEGSVRDLRTGELTTVDPEDPHLIQTCISAAAGPCRIAV